MRAIRTILFASIVTACGGGSEKPDALIIVPDAPPDAAPDAFEVVYDFSCMGNAAPTTAPANITLSGTVNEVVLNGVTPGIAPSHAATVATCKTSGGVACANTDSLDTQTTPAMNCPTAGCPFTTGMLATQSVPLDAFAKVTKANNRTTLIFPVSPFSATVPNVPALTFTNNAFGGITAFIGVTQDAAKGNLILAFVDCANMPIASDLTISVKQGGVAVAGTSEFDPSALASQLAGARIVFNVPAGVTEVGAMYKNKTLLSHNVIVAAQSSTATIVRPGY